MLEDLKRDFALSVAEVNILKDPATYETYKYLIPVIVLENGRIIAARFTETELRKALLEVL